MLFSQDLLNQLGVIDWGYTDTLEAKSFRHYQSWAHSSAAGSLTYLQDHRLDLRKDLLSIRSDAQAAFVFLFDYHATRLALDQLAKHRSYNGLKLASYSVAFEGEDYHRQLNERLNKLGATLQHQHSDLSYTVCLDTKPVLERDLAYRAGLGWFGKNSMLISPHFGSFFLIGSLVVNKRFDLEKRELETDHCGQCRACVQACPTEAIDEQSRTLKADLCISTYTIEVFKETAQIPEGFDQSQGEIFGCDICQDACPWNERPVRLGKVKPAPDLSQVEVVVFYLLRPLQTIVDELSSWSNNYFKKFFAVTAFARTGRVGLLKNLRRLLSPNE